MNELCDRIANEEALKAGREGSETQEVLAETATGFQEVSDQNPGGQRERRRQRIRPGIRPGLRQGLRGCQERHGQRLERTAAPAAGNPGRPAILTLRGKGRSTV